MTTELINMLVIIFLIIFLAIGLIYFFIKETNKVTANSNKIIDELRDEIEKISTIEQCETIKLKIRKHYEETETLYSSIKQEYIKLYFIVVGIEKTIKKLIQR